MTLLLWSKSTIKADGSGGDSIMGSSERLTGAKPGRDLGNSIDSLKAPEEHVIHPVNPVLDKVNEITQKNKWEHFDSSKLDEARRNVLAENTDEFLDPVLRDVKYTEVDLNGRREVVLDDYDEEIVDDLKRVKPGLGEKGEKATVPSYQKSVADNIMKKEAFNRLLSEMISPNRSVPDTREPE